ncbi:MAG: hypothetical protein ACI353_07195 [Alloprevotella sp.]
MKHLYLLTIFLFSLCLLSCGDDSENEPAIIEDSHTVLKRQLCEAFGLNPSDLDEDAFGACWNDQFLVVSALRTTDSKLVVAAFDSISNRQVINDFSISMPKTITRPYYDQQVEYSLRYVVPRIIRIKDGFVCSIGARYIANQDFFDNTHGYFYNGTNLVCTKLENVSANGTMTAWYENSCLLTDHNQTVCYTTDGEIKARSEEQVSTENAYPITYDKFIRLSMETIDGRVGIKTSCRQITEKAITTEWSTRTDLPDTITTSARITFSIQDQNANLWVVQVEVTDKDGTQLHYQLSINTNTGECLLTKV